MSDNNQSWSNWARNQTCHPKRIVHPTSENDLIAVIADANSEGHTVRMAGSGHSFSPICVTDGTLIILDQLSGLIDVNSTTRNVRAWAGTRIRDFGPSLWTAGLCLKNQGDIDTQQIGGAIGTATHGSGIDQQSFSATVKSLRIVTATGEVLEVDARTPELLAAARVSMGMLGAVTQVDLETESSFGLRERIEYWHIDEVLSRWDHEMNEHRHFSFFWMPYEDSPELLFLDTPDGLSMGDRAMVKIYDQLDIEEIDQNEAHGEHGRRDRPYRIYPDPDFEGEPVNRELEYMVPFAAGKEAFLALRDLIFRSYPESKFPVEVRSVKGDDAWLSPFYERDSISISICGHEDRDYERFLTDVARVLDPFEARPHWGKLNYMNRERLDHLFPKLEAFREVRRRLDPDGLFLSPALATIFA